MNNLQDNSGEPYAIVKHFMIRFYNSAKKLAPKMEEKLYAVEYTKYQDTLDLFAYTYKDGIPYVLVSVSDRPVIALRETLLSEIKEYENKAEATQFLEVPAGYIREEKGQIGLVKVAEDIFLRKLPGAKATGTLRSLGGAYFPSVGGSTELVFPRSIECSLDESFKEETVKLMTLEEIVNGYFKGEIKSTRLMELTLRFADRENISLTFPNVHLTNETKKLKEFSKERFANKDEIKRIASGIEDSLDSITHIEAIPTDEIPERPFLKAKRVDFMGKKVDMVYRKGFDSVDTGCYFWKGDSLYMPIKYGVRPTLAVRNLRPHPIHTEVNPLFIEGVAGSLENEKNLIEIGERAKIETEEEISLPIIGAPVYISYDYPSPGHNPERVYRFLVEVDPTQKVHREQTLEETVGVRYVELNDLIELIDEGIIRDPRLSLNARLIRELFKYPMRNNEEDILLREGFEELINSGSKIQEWLSREALEIDTKLNRSVLYRRLKLYCENDLGVVSLSLPHPEEAHFFNAMLPVFAIPTPDDPRRLPFYFLHDLFHYATGGYIPIIAIYGERVELQPFSEYMKAIGGNECEAVWYSDVIMPKEFGLEDAEAIFGGDSVAKVFQELELDDDEARVVIRSIELKGRVPDRVLTHPLFEKYRGTIVGRLLRYYIMDLDNTKGVYEYWEKHPRIVKIASRFSNVFSNVADYENYYHKILDTIKNYSEGANPLKAELSRTINYRIRLTAFRLAFLDEKISENKKGEYEKMGRKIAKHIEELYGAQQKLLYLRDRVVNTDPTKENIQAFKDLKEIIETIANPAEDLANSLSRDTTYLTRDDIEKTKDRKLPYYEGFKPIDPDYLTSELARLEKENLNRVK
jgi:hypothetical protein